MGACLLTYPLTTDTGPCSRPPTPPGHAAPPSDPRVRAFRPCAAGQQLFLSYGPYPNGTLLLFYGFALPDNPVDEVAVALQVRGESYR